MTPGGQLERIPEGVTTPAPFDCPSTVALSEVERGTVSPPILLAGRTALRTYGRIDSHQAIPHSGTLSGVEG